jgi:hypothetical protein
MADKEPYLDDNNELHNNDEASEEPLKPESPTPSLPLEPEPLPEAVAAAPPPPQLNPREKLRERTMRAVQDRIKEKLKEDQKQQEREEKRIAFDLLHLNLNPDDFNPFPKGNLPVFPDSLSRTPYKDIHHNLRQAFNRVWDEAGSSISAARIFVTQRRAYWHAVGESNAWRRWLFSDEFMRFRERDFIPRVWMLNDEVIKGRLEDINDVDFIRLKTLLNHVWKNILDRPECLKLAEKIVAGGIPKIEIRSKRDDQGKIIESEEVPVVRDYAFLKPLDFEAIQKQYGKGYSERNVEEYMHGFAMCGILKRFDRRPGPRNQTVYAIGYWSPSGMKNTFKVQPFLKNTAKFRAVLRGFELPKKG